MDDIQEKEQEQEQFPGFHDEPQFLQPGFDHYIPSDNSLSSINLLSAEDFGNNESLSYLPHSLDLSPGSDQGSLYTTDLHIDTRRLTPLRPCDSGGSAVSTRAPSSVVLTPGPGSTMDTPLHNIRIDTDTSPYSVPDASTTHFSPINSPSWCAASPNSPTEGVQVEQSNNGDDEAAEAMLPHIANWFWVQRSAIIETGTGIFVPQKIYRPYTEADQRRYVTECELRPIIYFLSGNPFEHGMALDNAIKSKHQDLQDKDDPMFVGCGPSVSIHIEWPGYRPWAKQISTNDFKTPKGPITRAKLAKNLANCVKRFIGWAAEQPMETNADPRWKVGPKHIKVEDLILVSLHHVTKGSWQPQLRLRRESYVESAPSDADCSIGLGQAQTVQMSAGVNVHNLTANLAHLTV